MRPQFFALTLALSISVVACDSFDSSSSGPTAPVAVSIEIAPQGNASAKSEDTNSIEMTGFNGSLRIDDVRFILDRFKLGADEGSCTDPDGVENQPSDGEIYEACAEMGVGPVLVQVPLDNQSRQLFAADIPLGLYSEIGFEIDNLDPGNQQLLSSIREQYPNWPDEASVRVSGRFTAPGAAPRIFTIYIDAHVELQLRANPPLNVTAEGVGQAMTLVLDPLQWFALIGSNEVPDISPFDYEVSGFVPVFDLSLKHGFQVHTETD